MRPLWSALCSSLTSALIGSLWLGSDSSQALWSYLLAQYKSAVVCICVFSFLASWRAIFKTCLKYFFSSSPLGVNVTTFNLLLHAVLYFFLLILQFFISCICLHDCGTGVWETFWSQRFFHHHVIFGWLKNHPANVNVKAYILWLVGKQKCPMQTILW